MAIPCFGISSLDEFTEVHAELQVRRICQRFPSRSAFVTWPATFPQISTSPRACSYERPWRIWALDAAQAVPLVLVTNELLSNAFKHAFPDGRAGEIFLELLYTRSIQNHQDSGELSISYNGVGWTEGLDFLTAKSTGLRICRGLVKQIRGSIRLETDPGGQWRILFPAAASGGRIHSFLPAAFE